MRYFIFFVFLRVIIANEVNIGSFIQLSDGHYDSLYAPNSPTNCLFGSTGLGCCRKDSIPLDPPGNASIWGDYNCDMSTLLLEKSLDWINKSLGNIDFYLKTGDWMHHHDVEYSVERNLQNIDAFTKIFNKYIPYSFVYPILGNHESFIIDQQYFVNSIPLGETPGPGNPGSVNLGKKRPNDFRDL